MATPDAGWSDRGLLFQTMNTINKTETGEAEIREYGGMHHVWTTDGYYHCTCPTREKAERIIAERFPKTLLK